MRRTHFGVDSPPSTGARHRGVAPSRGCHDAADRVAMALVCSRVGNDGQSQICTAQDRPTLLAAKSESEIQCSREKKTSVKNLPLPSSQPTQGCTPSNACLLQQIISKYVVARCNTFGQYGTRGAAEQLTFAPKQLIAPTGYVTYLHNELIPEQENVRQLKSVWVKETERSGSGHEKKVPLFPSFPLIHGHAQIDSQNTFPFKKLAPREFWPLQG